MHVPWLSLDFSVYFQNPCILRAIFAILWRMDEYEEECMGSLPKCAWSIRLWYEQGLSMHVPWLSLDSRVYFQNSCILRAILPYYGEWMSKSNNALVVCPNVHGASDYGPSKVWTCMSRDSIFKILAYLGLFYHIMANGECMGSLPKCAWSIACSNVHGVSNYGLEHACLVTILRFSHIILKSLHS